MPGRTVVAAPLSGVLAGVLLALLTACSGPSPSPSSSARASQPSTAGSTHLPPVAEPQEPRPTTTPPAGSVVALPAGSRPEGLEVDPGSHAAVVALHHPSRLAVVSPGGAVHVERVAGAARHLRAAGAGEVLVPGEDTGTLAEVDVATGRVVWSVRTGRRPHDAQAGADGTVLSSNEKGGSVLFSRRGRALATVAAGIQPGGVAVSGGIGVAVDVRGDAGHLSSMRTHRQRAVLPAGKGPTHAEALSGSLVAVADTVGDALLVDDVGASPRQVGSTPVAGGPYALGYDPVRHHLWVAGSGSDVATAYAVAPDGRLTQVASIATVAGPYSLAVDPQTGDLWVAGVADSQLQQVPLADQHLADG